MRTCFSQVWVALLCINRAGGVAPRLPDVLRDRILHEVRASRLDGCNKIHFLQKTHCNFSQRTRRVIIKNSSTESAPDPTEAGESRQVLLEAVWAELHKVVHVERWSAPNRERRTELEERWM